MRAGDVELILELFPYATVNVDGSLLISAFHVREFLWEAKMQRLKGELDRKEDAANRERQELHEKLYASLPSWRKALLSLSSWLWDKGCPQWGASLAVVRKLKDDVLGD